MIASFWFHVQQYNKMKILRYRVKMSCGHNGVKEFRYAPEVGKKATCINCFWTSASKDLLESYIEPTVLQVEQI